MDERKVLKDIHELTESAARGGTSRLEAAVRIKSSSWLRHPSASVKERAIQSCAALGLDGFEIEMQQLLNDRDPQVRFSAVAYFKMFDFLQPDVVKDLIATMRDSNSQVRREAREVIAAKISAAGSPAKTVTHPISPWAERVTLLSPDRRYTAHFSGMAISDGLPTAGEIHLEDVRIRAAGASMIWSPDSAYLAFPRFTLDGKQRLHVLDLEKRRRGFWPALESVFQTHEFTGQELRATADPLGSRRVYVLPLNKVIWA